jgi:hypothetical protein
MAETKKPAQAKKKKQKKKPAGAFYSPLVTILLICVLVLLIRVIWAVFVGGPAAIYQEQQEIVTQAILEKVPDIQGLERNVFDYVTWQGYDTTTLYWFDANGDEITTRSLDTLDYAAARQKALESYGVNAQTVELCYGYNAPVYELRSENTVLMLDYDTLAWVYERNTGNE